MNYRKLKIILTALLCLSVSFTACSGGASTVQPDVDAEPSAPDIKPTGETLITDNESKEETPAPEAEIKANKPFPQDLNYENCIKPNHVTKEQIIDGVTGCYESWKRTYIKESNGVTPGGGYYVEMKGTGGDGNEITTSEAHGYGMIIFALMAGYEKDAKKYFDGMYNMYNKHRSTGNKNNMSWVIDKSELTEKDSASATDGDMDIAYALLLADAQWGSDGEINYLKEAQRIISEGIKVSDMSVETKRTILGDWDTNNFNTRASDWMTGHFRAYYKATNDPFWNEAADTVYDIINRITEEYSPYTGLMPDFIVEDPPKPAPKQFLEGDTDGDYSWNSCRYPFRIVMDYALYGTPEAKEACNKMVNWIKEQTSNDPSKIKAGYSLGGGELADYGSAAFTAPFIAACIVDSTHQEYLNEGWYLIKRVKQGYYSDSISLLCLLLISGNWWAPN